jgi:hypothetical protein
MPDALVDNCQHECDRRAASDFRLGADPPAVGLYQPPGYGQTKAGAAGLGAGHGQEAVEDAREISRWNAVSGVGDGDRYVIWALFYLSILFQSSGRLTPRY